MNIFNLNQLITLLDKQINIQQFTAICVKNVLVHKCESSLNKEVHKSLFDLSNEDILNELMNILTFTNQDLTIINNTVNEYIRTKRINIDESINISNENVIKQFLLKYLLKSPYWKLIKKTINDIKNKILPSTLKELINTPIGQYVPIPANIIKKELHSMYVTPIIYINGNIIWGNKDSTINAAQANREYHSDLLLKYLNDMSLHKNDIIELAAKEWKNQDVFSIPLICTYVRLVTDDNIFVILYDEGNIDISQKFYQLYHKPVFVITDNVSNLKRLAKINQKYIVRII